MSESGSDFESIGYFNHCFYRGRDFGQCDRLSVSPSGRYALWQDSSSGGLRVFSPRWREPQFIFEEFQGLVLDVAWDEDASQVHVTFAETDERQGGTRTFTLPEEG